MTTRYHTQAFEDLRGRILRVADPRVQLECSLRAERVAADLVADDSYSPDALAQRILSTPDETGAESERPGSEVRQDILHLIADLASESAVPLELAPEPVAMIEEVARKWNVSTKTISRWRERGLIGRTFLVEGRKRVGFLSSSLNSFAVSNPGIIRRGSSFTRISDEERAQTVRRAEAELGRGVSIAQVISGLAADTQRSPDSIRQLLRQAGMAELTVGGGLSETAQRRLYGDFLLGKSIDRLADQFGISSASARATVNRLRTERILELPLDYMPSPEFQEVPQREILSAPPQPSGRLRMPRKPTNLPAYIASLYDVPLLTADQERHLFRKYNYLKYRASQLRDQLDRNRPKESVLDRIEQLYEAALATKNLLVQSNMRLVVAVAKKYADATQDLFEKVSEGNMSLMRAVEKFDYMRGFKFSTYATWAIKKNFIRAYSTEVQRADRYRTGHESFLDARPAYRADPHQQLTEQRQREEQVSHIMQRLTERERQIISSRFGIGSGQEPMTLKDIGVKHGVSKERVRQIEARAMQKLREAASHAKLELPSFEEELTFRDN